MHKSSVSDWKAASIGLDLTLTSTSEAEKNELIYGELFLSNISLGTILLDS